MNKAENGLFARFAAALLMLVAISLASPAPVRADVQDIAAASRSVVRVALVATDGQNAYFVGHGSGVVIAPGRVLTNAHVVELARSEPNIVIGIIPAEGSRSFGGKIIAFSPGNDLALLSMDGGNPPVATFLSGTPEDGSRVTAIGYPGSVDRAQGMSIEDIIKPMSAVRTSGTVSAGRASRQFDTILHTAPLASGNSGGPLVDDCGRVIGINSFGSLSEGSDAEYGFAVSNREIASFLRQAGIQVRRSSDACRSMADLEAAQFAADEQARIEATRRADEAAIAQRERLLQAREQSQQTIIAKRENMMALAALLLVFAALAGSAAMLSQSKGNLRKARQFGAGAGVLLLGAVILFALRPSFDSLEAPVPADGNSAANMADAGTAIALTGRLICEIDTSLSRVTTSDTQNPIFSWSNEGCVNGQTQFVNSQGSWSRILVPADEASVSVRRFDPASGRYRSDNYQVSAETAERARAARAGITWSGCTSDPAQLAALAKVQADIQSTLPSQPNERLVYRCRSSTPAAGSTASPPQSQ